MSIGRIATRVFTTADQIAFARLSGDYNPMHVDDLAARRTQAGAPVVHGVHAALWMLETLARHGVQLDTIASLTLRFTKFVFLDIPADMALTAWTEKAVDAELSVKGLTVLKVRATFGARKTSGDEVGRDAEAVPTGTVPNEPAFEDLEGVSGWLSPLTADDDWAAAFPAAARQLTPARLAALGAMSRLVGMVAPGLHSIFVSCTVDIVHAGRPGLGYRVLEADERFRLVNLAVGGGGLAGQVSSFMRWPPVASAGMPAIASRVDAMAFAGSTSLLIGGSRGLGAVAAKLLAAGGGRVVVTYARGKSDAETLVEEINTFCGKDVCSAVRLDVQQPVGPQIDGIMGVFTHFHYYATPSIFVQKASTFSKDLLDIFNRFYVSAFFEAVEALLRNQPKEPLSVLYPSSVAVDERPPGLTEYAMAKAAGEILAADLAEVNSHLKILVSRLPRVLTDQTASVVDVDNADPIETMLPLCMKLAEVKAVTA